MKKPKEFDCAKMKWDIQQHLLEEYSEMSPEQVHRCQQQRIASDPVLGPFLRKVAASSPAAPQSHK